MAKATEHNKQWKTVKLGEYALIVRGGSPRPIDSYITSDENGINWIKIGDIDVNGKYVEKTSEKIIPEGKLYSREVHKGDFILSNSMSFGRPYILKIDGCIHDGWLAIQNYEQTFDTNFLFYVLSSDLVKKQYLSMASGSTVLNLNKEKVAQIEIPVPGLSAQRRIAAILASADKVIAATQKTIAKYKQIKQGMMEELLNVQWRKVKLGEVAIIVRGGSPRPIDSYITTEENGINWIKIGDIDVNGKYVEKTSEKIIPEGKLYSREVHNGDFILSNSMSFGRPYIVKIDGCIHDGWLAIQNYEHVFDTDFLFYVLSSDMVKSQYSSMASGSTVLNLNKEKVAQVTIAVPSIVEQRRISKILSGIDAKIAAEEKVLEKYEKVKKGLMERLLNGE